MEISAINFSNVSFARRRENHSPSNTLSKILLPAALLLSPPTMTPSIAQDIFEKTPEEFFAQDMALASSLGVDCPDSYIKHALNDKTVTIDAGHGGKRSTDGFSPTGARYYDYKNKKWVYEKDLTLEISKEVQNLLKQAGATIVMTRDSDNYVALEDRAKLANDKESDMFVSVHVNNNPHPSIRGPEIYTCTPSQRTDAEKGAFKLADFLNKRLWNLYKMPEGKVKSNDFNVLAGTKSMPGVLVEIGYLSNPKDRELILDKEYRSKIAKQIAAGIIEYWVEKKFMEDTADFNYYFAQNKKSN